MGGAGTVWLPRACYTLQLQWTAWTSLGWCLRDYFVSRLGENCQMCGVTMIRGVGTVAPVLSWADCQPGVWEAQSPADSSNNQSIKNFRCGVCDCLNLTPLWVVLRWLNWGKSTRWNVSHRLDSFPGCLIGGADTSLYHRNGVYLIMETLITPGLFLWPCIFNCPWCLLCFLFCLWDYRCYYSSICEKIKKACETYTTYLTHIM